MRFQLDIALTEEDYLAFNYFHALESESGKKLIRKTSLIFIAAMVVLEILVFLLHLGSLDFLAFLLHPGSLDSSEFPVQPEPPEFPN